MSARPVAGTAPRSRGRARRPRLEVRAAQSTAEAEPASVAWFSAADPFVAYFVDVAQRAVLFLDVLRERGDAMLEHEHAGMPPLLAYPYETVLDARTFDAPASYALLRIVAPDPPRHEKRPVIVFDPRAGHGPGIGGFKKDSEVGMALQLGHPVYFVSFFPQPMPEPDLGRRPSRAAAVRSRSDSASSGLAAGAVRQLPGRAGPWR